MKFILERKVGKIKWLLIILSGTLLLGPTEAQGADWKYFGRTQTASYFFDVESMIRQEDIVRVWVKVVYSEKGRLDEEGKLGGRLLEFNRFSSFGRNEL